MRIIKRISILLTCSLTSSFYNKKKGAQQSDTFQKKVYNRVIRLAQSNFCLKLERAA